MTAPQTPVPRAKTIRLMHAAMVLGVFLFALMAHFFVRPGFTDSATLPTIFVRVALGVSLAACAVSFVLRQRVPRRSGDESVDLFWTSAATPALLTWAALDGAALLAIVVYVLSGATEAIAVAAIILIAFAAMNPGYLERR